MAKTENKSAEETVDKKEGLNTLLTDFGPVFLFMITYNVMNRIDQERAIIFASAAIIISTVLALIWSLWKHNRVPYIAIATTVAVSLFYGATIFTGDAIYAKIKPTFMNLLFATAILGSVLFGRNIWKLAFGGAFDLPDQVWTHLAVRWGLFFVFLAVLNEFIWRNYSEAFWANFKFFGVLPITILFALSNIPITLKWFGKSEDDYREGRSTPLREAIANMSGDKDKSADGTAESPKD
jgi:intracellular septation protein